MLAVQLMNPTAAAAAALVRNSEGKVKNAGKYAIVPHPIMLHNATSSALECGRTNQARVPTPRRAEESQNANGVRAFDPSSNQRQAVRSSQPQTESPQPIR